MAPTRLLRWLYLGRLTLAAGIFGGALFTWQRTTPATTLLATLTLLLSLGSVLAGLWWTQRRVPGKPFLYLQVIFDTLLITAIVHMTAQAGTSPFAPLYILNIAAGALLLPLPGGVLVGALASALYFADAMWLQSGVPTISVVLQIGVFALMALATGMLGDRLRRTGAALGAAESELRQLRLDTSEILATIDTGLITVDGAGRLVQANDAALGILNLRRDDWPEDEVLDALDRKVAGLGAMLRRTAATRVPVRRSELRMRRTDGDHYIGVRTTVLEREGVPWVTAVLQDITESKQVEDLIRRAERLQAVAELGASLAHEIKNPLASIRSASEQLAQDRISVEDRGVLRKLVVAESERLSRLLSEFMEFSRVELRRWNPLDLRDVTREAVDLVQQHPDAARGIGIEVSVPEDPLVVDGDEDLLHRAIFNLVLNAVQHSTNGGPVQIELGRAFASDVPPSVHLEAPIRLSVRDSGPGIPQEEVAHLFDPFYTRREGGTGLGLAMVHRAVEAHSGAIMVDGDPGNGACFTVYLPAHAVRRS
jgi:two-component system sensor histidine kinase PilS (NtrC family)